MRTLIATTFFAATLFALFVPNASASDPVVEDRDLMVRKDLPTVHEGSPFVKVADPASSISPASLRGVWYATFRDSGNWVSITIEAVGADGSLSGKIDWVAPTGPGTVSKPGSRKFGSLPNEARASLSGGVVTVVQPNGTTYRILRFSGSSAEGDLVSTKVTSWNQPLKFRRQ